MGKRSRKKATGRNRETAARCSARKQITTENSPSNLIQKVNGAANLLARNFAHPEELNVTPLSTLSTTAFLTLV